MNIYITDGTEESFYTAAFTACTDAGCLVCSAREIQLCIDAALIRVAPDEEKCGRVKRKLTLCDPHCLRDISLLLRRGWEGREQLALEYLRMIVKARAPVRDRLADKTVLKMMREMGLRCGIRRETDYHRYSSYRGVVGETFENVLGRDFKADGPWQKMGTDVTEFKLSFGKAYLAPVYDFGSREIVAWSVSEHPDLAQQEEMLGMLMEAKPRARRPCCTPTWAGSTSTRSTSARSPRTASPRACRARATASTTARPSSSSAT